MDNKATILTGDRPAGPLHPGHYVGSLRQCATLQHGYQQSILVTGLQRLVDSGSTPQKIHNSIPKVLINYPTARIDPSFTTICLQSTLLALAELTTLYMSIVTAIRMERNPTVKNEITQKGFARLLPVDFLAYPISQATDITAFKAEVVPADDDQLPMIEQTSKIVHKINSLLPAPVLSHYEALLNETSRLPGVDGNAKMLELLDNTLLLSASEEVIRRAISVMYTGPNHLEVSNRG